MARATFILIAAFWVAMNVLLWRAEYSPHGGGEPVPVGLVCQKILTAPDISSLNVYQNGDRTGFAEFSTSVEQAMAQLDADAPPPPGLATRTGYQIRLNGNVSLGDFTNRVQFDAHLRFSPRREWRELSVKLTTHFASVKIHSVATNETVTVEITSPDNPPYSREFTFAELQDPNTLLHALADNSGGGFLTELDWPAGAQTTSMLADSIHWEASRDRVKIGRETVAAYRLETHVLGWSASVYVSTLGEILRVDLPGNVTATLDEWSK